MSVVGEFFQFCNDLIAGSPVTNDEDTIPSIIRSSNTMEAIQQQVSNVINDSSSIIDQSLIADKNIKVDCGIHQLNEIHLRPMKKEYTWFGAEIEGSGCPSYGCCYDVSQNSQISLSAVNSTVIKDTQKMYNKISQELENQVSLTLQGNKLSQEEKFEKAMDNLSDTDGDGLISQKEVMDQMVAALRPPTALTEAINKSENTSIKNIERILENLTKTDIVMEQNIEIVSLSPLACVNKCDESPSAGRINQSLNVEIAAKNIVEVVTESIVKNYVEQTSKTSSKVSDVDMRKIYLFAIMFVIFVTIVYVLVYIVLSGILVVTVLLKKPQWIINKKWAVHSIAIIWSLIIWWLWSLIICIARGEGGFLGPMGCFIR